MRIGLSAPDDLWRRFRVACLQRNISASNAVTALLVEQLARWDQQLGRGQGSDYPPPLSSGLLNEIPETITALDTHLQKKDRP